jgi:hypothetical protein
MVSSLQTLFKLHAPAHHFHACYMPHPSHSPLFYDPNNNKQTARIAWLVQQWAMDWTAGVQFPEGARLLSTATRQTLGPTKSPIQQAPVALSPGGGLKQQGREAKHSPPSSVEVKNSGAITPLPMHLHGTVLK